MKKENLLYAMIGLFMLAMWVYFWKKKNPEMTVKPVAPNTPPVSPTVPAPAFTPNDLHSLYRSQAYPN